MASGVKVDDEVKSVYQQIALTTAKTKKMKCAVFKFSDDLKKIVVEKSISDEDAKKDELDYDNLIASLPEDDVRYVAYDFDFYNKEDTKKSDIVMVSWHPEKSSIKKKMVCASSLNALKSSLSISKNVLEGDVCQDVDSNAALQKVGGKKKAAP